AALAGSRWMGRGDKNAADGAAVDAMRLMLDTVSVDGVVVIGEGEKDEAPMLYNGERVGTGEPPAVDIAVDPIDGTRLLSRGGAIQGRLWPRNDDERNRAIDAGYDLSRVLTTNDLVSGDDVFFAATGVTDGYLLDGVRTVPDGAITESLVMRSRSGTIRTVRSEHRW